MAIICLTVFFALAIFIKLKMPMWKGKYSEKLVHKKMLQLPDEYTIFNDFCLRVMDTQLKLTISSCHLMGYSL